MFLSFDDPSALWWLMVLVPMGGLFWVSRRRLTTPRWFLALSTRVLLVVLVVLSLAGLSLHRPANALGVVFVVDRSASTGAGGTQQAEAFIKDALRHAEANDQVGVVVFGNEAMVESEPAHDLRFDGFEADPSTHQTDIAAGLRLATAMLPSDRNQRLILLTDGEQTRGDAASQVLLTAGDGLELGVVELGGTRGADIRVEDLIVPVRIDEGAAFEVKAVVAGSQGGSGKLRLYRNDDFLGEMPVDLPDDGRSKVLSFRQRAGASGLYRYRATFEADDSASDTLPQNNQSMATVQVKGRPRILLVDSKPSEVAGLATILERSGMDVDRVGPAQIPSGIPELRQYAAVFLSDVPAYVLSGRQQNALQSYVRDLGRGLVMIGGPNSFGVGGYYDTPVEAALPVKMDIEDKARFPRMAMIHALDKSCSMGGSASNSPLFLAKEAAIQTVDLLSEHDRLGIIGFDAAASFIVPMEPLTDKEGVKGDIASIRSGGGTNIYPALKRSVETLAASDAAVKHIILLSDGVTSSADFKTLLENANQNDQITVTSLAMGKGADRTTMENFARWGGGNYYLVTDASAIPAIFTRETLLASRQFLREEVVQPLRHRPSELTKGLGTLPTLDGYVVTTPRPRATVSLVIEAPDDRKDPLLAQWRYGLGRSVAYTSDAKSRWSSRWRGSEAYTRMWSQIGRFAVALGNDQSVDLQTEIREGRLYITVDAFGKGGGFRNFLKGEGRVVAPDLTVRPLDLQQIAPGRYQASMPVDQDGSFVVGVSLRDGDELVGQAVEEAVQPYSPEYRAPGAGRALLTELASTGGLGTLKDAASVFTRPAEKRTLPTALWPWLLAMAMILFVFDIATRRFALGGRGAATLTRPAAAHPAFQFTRSAGPRPLQREPSDDDAPEEPVDVAPSKPAPVAPAERVDPTSYAGRLLAARKNARNRIDDGDDG